MDMIYTILLEATELLPAFTEIMERLLGKINSSTLQSSVKN